MSHPMVLYKPYVPKYRLPVGSLDYLLPSEMDIVDCLRGNRLSVREINKEKNISTTTVQESLKRLYHRGWLRVFKAYGRSRNNPPLVYELSEACTL